MNVYPATVKAAIQLANKYKKHNPRGDSNKKPDRENIGVSFAQSVKMENFPKGCIVSAVVVSTMCPLIVMRTQPTLAKNDSRKQVFAF